MEHSYSASLTGTFFPRNHLNSGDFATWPVNVDQTNPATTWANLKSRYPIDYAIVLDQSGSMLSDDKWDNAKEATNFFESTMAILADTTYFQDRIGLVTFKSPCSGTGETTDFEQSLAQISQFPISTAITDGVSTPVSNNCTPIGNGLKAAFADPATDGDADENDGLNANLSTAHAERERIVLLLSDGLHNRPDSSLDPTVAELGYIPCTDPWGTDCPAGTVSNVRVNAVGLGNDGTVPVALLNDIKQRYGSQDEFDPLPRYNITTDSGELREIFLNSLQDIYGMNLVDSSDIIGSVFPSVAVNAGEQRLIVILSWDDEGQAEQFDLQNTAGDRFSCNDFSPTSGFAACIVDNPQASAWQVVASSLTNDPQKQFFLVDLNLQARFGIDRVVHGTGRDIILTAELKKAGQPLTNDTTNHPVKVTANIEEPQEGFGEFVSTHELQSCEVRPPQLPQFPGRPGSTVPRVLSSRPASMVAAAAAAPNDPPTPPFALAKQLFQDCDQDGLLRSEEPGLELQDNSGIAVISFDFSSTFR